GGDRQDEQHGDRGHDEGRLEREAAREGTRPAHRERDDVERVAQRDGLALLEEEVSPDHSPLPSGGGAWLASATVVRCASTNARYRPPCRASRSAGRPSSTSRPSPRTTPRSARRAGGGGGGGREARRAPRPPRAGCGER